MNTNNIETKVAEAMTEHDPKTLALGFLRYEALRKLSPLRFYEIHKRNLSGERFDDMIDQLITKP